jgi:hypothetical protein
MSTISSSKLSPSSVPLDGTPASDLLYSRLKRAARTLCDALREVIAGVPGPSTRRRQFARLLKAHRVVVGRLLKAVDYSDPLAALCEMPRAEGLRAILKASRSWVHKETIERANQAITDLERVLDEELGGWSALHSVASEWLPEARRKLELANKQAIYKGMANIMGCCADAEFCGFIGYPGNTVDRVDAAMIAGTMGLRRIRPSAEICFTSVGISPDEPRRITIKGILAGDAPDSHPLLEPFCSSPLPKFRVVRSERRAHYLLAGDAVGPGSAVNIATASIMAGRHPRYQTDPPRRIAAFGDSTVPCKSLIMDILLHEDIWPGATPELIMYNTTQQETANPNSPTEGLHRLKVTETIEYLGKGAARFRIAEVGHYVEMVQYVCRRLGWEAERLRGYRCHIRYPIFGTSVCVVFTPPPKPSGNGATSAATDRPAGDTSPRRP